jgi:hypothetical protein
MTGMHHWSLSLVEMGFVNFFPGLALNLDLLDLNLLSRVMGLSLHPACFVLEARSHRELFFFFFSFGVSTYGLVLVRKVLY